MLGLLVSIACHALTCGPGTELRGGSCVPADDSDAPRDTGTGSSVPRYELSVTAASIAGDGESKLYVHALGTNADGSPILDDIVFGASREDAGSFDTTAAQLGPKGTTVSFTPCNALTPGCTGPVELTFALAASPAAPLASVSVEIVFPEDLENAAPCLVGGNALFLDGDGKLFTGTTTILAGKWDAGGDEREIRVEVIPTDDTQGKWWGLLFGSTALNEDLAVGVYEDVDQELNGPAPGHPGMLVRGYLGAGESGWCDEVDGQFQIHELHWIGNLLDFVTVSFEQYCDGDAVPLTGCVHYEQ